MTYRALVVEETSEGEFSQDIRECEDSFLPEQDTRIRVQWSSLNFKDALSFSGHRGVTRSYPHTPGIDAAGIVESSSCFEPGTPVIVTGYDLGMNTPGGLSERIQVPSNWVIPLPEGFSLKEAMTYGTAGFTAGQCVERLLENRVEPDDGPIVVTGATGGVGSVAVALLAAKGFEVIAASRDPGKAAWLTELGASGLVPASDLLEDNGKPLLSGRWAGAVDTVGGKTLEVLTRSMQHRGVITCCGMITGTDVHTNIFPFIIRGLSVIGIDSAECPYDRKVALWNKLAGPWAPKTLAPLLREIPLDQTPEQLRAMLRGQPGSGGGSGGELKMRLGGFVLRFKRLAPSYGPHYGVATQGYLRGLGLIYLLSFWSFAAQAQALSGDLGLQPIRELMQFLQTQSQLPAPVWFPSLLWIDSGNWMLLGVCAAGMVAGLGLLWGFVPWVSGLVAWICHVSLLQVCQPWLSGPGDFLLAEMGFLALFFMPPRVIRYPRVEKMGSHLTGILLLNALTAKLLVFSGLTQLRNGSSSWTDATALFHFFETQSIPTIPAWYLHHLPQTLLIYGVWAIVFVELVLPFYILFPRVFRNLAAGGICLLALVLLSTGHYGLLPLQFMLLALTLVDDVSWRLLLPESWGPPPSISLYRPPMPAKLLLIALLPLMLLQAFPRGAWVMTTPWRGMELLLERVHASNRYALFPQVPDKRYELTVQASRDGRDWVEYAWSIKPSHPARLSPVSFLHLPRLDNQLVHFAQQVARNPNQPAPDWFKRLSGGLLAGNPFIRSLLPVDPFPDRPPEMIRWILVEYRFADPVTRREENVWWTRTIIGPYGPVIHRQHMQTRPSGLPQR